MRDEGALTPLEVAEILRISKGTVYEMAKRGELNSFRVGNKVRFELKDVEDYKSKSKKFQSDKVRTLDKTVPFESSTNYQSELTQKASGFVICGQDIMLDILSRHLMQHPVGIQALRSYTGSYNGLYALYQGNVQIATTHLWDGEDNIYNVPYVKRMLPGVPAAIIHLANRMQGLYVSKGNPKGIKGIDDLRGRELTIVNRERGSGTRVLLDEHLKRLKLSSSNILGYEKECTSHLAVASIVARGGADLALGSEKAAEQVKGIDFIPLQSEAYDMVIKKEDIHKPEFEAVLQIIRSEEFKQELLGIGGYELTDIGKLIAET